MGFSVQGLWCRASGLGCRAPGWNPATLKQYPPGAVAEAHTVFWKLRSNLGDCHVDTHTHARVHVYIYMFVYMYVKYVCVYIYVCMYTHAYLLFCLAVDDILCFKTYNIHMFYNTE